MFCQLLCGCLRLSSRTHARRFSAPGSSTLKGLLYELSVVSRPVNDGEEGIDIEWSAIIRTCRVRCGVVIVRINTNTGSWLSHSRALCTFLLLVESLDIYMLLEGWGFSFGNSLVVAVILRQVCILQQWLIVTHLIHLLVLVLLSRTRIAYVHDFCEHRMWAYRNLYG